ncbi:DNA internalization-related competence protein ComEC/Rec2 [Bacillus idriensis]|uniref:DNA internalization-related competence protein ComEC/Rec2 n=1 Tax=Metabacillus idriensis TaxID=324768 RepID=A0A6I2MF09_9BACI|nr:DNA internalization-related competence protein ComEC/Rec2 [Metabacillus idriensis]MRX55934.1 DNA internalization-related competence protein ComEC/Rec2 [Metabacillus idriensis]
MSKISYQGKLIYFAAAAGLAVAAAKFPFHPISSFTFLLFCAYLLFRKKSTLLIGCMAIFILFIFHFYAVEKSNASRFNKGKITIQGEFAEFPQIDGNQMKGVINVNQEKISAVYYFSSEEEKNRYRLLQLSTICTFKGELKPPKHATNPNAFDYADYLKNNRIHWILKADSIDQCRKENQTLSEKLKEFRQDGILFISKVFPEESRGIVQALLYGERTNISEDINKAYQELGIVHLLAISGLHVGILVSGLYFILIRSGMTHEKTKLLLILSLPVYCIIAGGAPSVLRAAGMSMLYLASKQLKLQLSTIDVISVAFLFLLFADPYYLFNVGFQLSFSVSMALILSARAFSKMPYRFYQLVAVSSVAQLASLPVILYNFYQISLLSLPMNLLFVPFYSVVILPLSLISVLAMIIFPPLGSFLIVFTDLVLQISNDFVLFINRFPSFMLLFGKPSFFFLFLFTLFLCQAFIAYEKSHRLKEMRLFVSFLVLLLFYQHESEYFVQTGEIVMLDVGQGDSIYLSAPHNQGTYLIDTGGMLTFNQEKWKEKSSSYSIAEDTLIPFLKSKGKRTLDKLILTHGDADHAGEVIDLLNEIRVLELIVPYGFLRGKFEQEIIDKAKSTGTEVSVLKSGDAVSDHFFKLHILSPIALSESENDDSLVIFAKIGGLKWLFTGDLEHEGEKRILEKYKGLKTDVLKVGHHGSKGSTSESFLKQLQPEFAFISAGENNRYNHPHDEVLQLLKKYDVSDLQTKRDGSITYKFHGDSGTFSVQPPYDSVSDK